jgi:hypothetical protein
MLQGGQLKEVLGTASKSDSAIGNIVTHGLTRLQTSRRREDLDAAMEEGMMEIVPRLERRTHYIATFANVITLVGLLGTIMGLIKAFTAVAQVNPAEKAELLSASISIAMNNTAFALWSRSRSRDPRLPAGAHQRNRRRVGGRQDQLPEPDAAHRARAPGPTLKRAPPCVSDACENIQRRWRSQPS